MAAVPVVEQHARRLADPGAALLAEHELGLMGDAGRDLRDRAGEALLHRAVDMAADHPLDLRVARDHRGELVAVAQHRVVHVADAGAERRVVQRDQGRLARPLGEALVEPGELLRAERAVGAALDQGVERDQPDREIVDRVADAAPRRDAGEKIERPAHRLARVVVADQRDIGRTRARPAIATSSAYTRSSPSLVRSPVITTRSGSGVEGVEMRDRALETARDVDLAERERALGQEVQVRHLGDQHGPVPRRRTRRL